MKIKSILFTILTALIFVYAVTHVITDRKLNNWINQNKDISVKATKLNLLLGKLTLYETAFYNKSYTTDTCKIKSVKIFNFSILDYLLKDEINIGELEINTAELFLSDFPDKNSKNKSKKKFYITKITTDNINLDYKTHQFSLQLKEGTVCVTDFSNSNKNYFTDLEVGIKGLNYKPEEGSYNFLAGKMELSTLDKIIKTNDFLIQPKCNINEWPSCYPNKNSRNMYTAESIIGKLDTESILTGVFLKELEINNGLYKIISFKEMEEPYSHKAFFMEKFYGLNIPIKIPTIKVKNHKVQVLLKEEKIDTLSFDQVYATFDNVCNLPELLKKNNNIKVTTLSKFMGADLKVDFDFKIKDSLNSYSLKLDLKPLPFTRLNKALNDNTSLVIEAGILQKLNCEVTGNNQLTDAKCDIAYEDLYVTIEGDDGLRKKLTSSLLNLIVKNDTGHTNGKIDPKTLTATLERKEDKGFFFHAYTIILKIIKKSILPL